MHLLLIFLDGFRYDYLSSGSTPFLYDMARKGFYAKLETLLGFSAGIHASIWSGTKPRTHGKWTKYFYEPYTPRSYLCHLFNFLPLKTIKSGIKVMYQSYLGRDPSLLPGLPPCLSSLFREESWLADTHENYVRHFENNSLRVSTLFDILRKNCIPYSFHFYRINQAREKQILLGSALYEGNVCHVSLIYIDSIDKVGHIHGPHSAKVGEELKKLDTTLSKLVEKLSFEDDLHITLFSDHGMTQVQRFANIQGLLKNPDLTLGKDYIAFHDATLSRFWFRSNSAKEKLISTLSAVSFGKILKDQDLKTYGIDFNKNDKRKFGELIFLVDPGVYIFPNYLHCTYALYHKASHGYDPKHESSYGAFLYCGPLNDRFKDIEKISILDILPTILDILDIPVSATCDGVSALSDT